MKLNRRQKAGLLIGLPILCLWAVAFYMVHGLDEHKIIQMMVSQVKAATGRDLVIRGPVSVSLFPRLSLTAEQIALSNATWAVDPSMVTADRVALSLRWMPLFRHRIEVHHVALENAQVFLQAAPLSQQVPANWVLDTTSISSEASVSDDAFVLDVDQIHLKQVQINYRDQTAALAQSATINRLDILESGGRSMLEGAFTLNNLPIELKGKTTSLVRLATGGADTRPAEVDLNLTLAGKLTQLQGTITLDSGSAPVVDLKVQSQGWDLRHWLASGALLPATSGAATPVTGSISTVTKQRPNADKGTRPRRVFSDKPIGFDQWPAWQGRVSLDLAALTLPDGLTLNQLTATLVADTGNQKARQDSLSITPLSFQLGEGRVTANGSVSDLHGAQPTMQLRGYATGFTLGHLMAQIGEGKQLSGGPTVVAFHLSSRGATPHVIANNLSGEAQLSVGPAVVSSALFNNSGDFLLSVLNAINPLRKSMDQNDLQCMVAYLPIQQGSIRINQSVGIRTERLDVTLAGKFDLGAETVTLQIYPHNRSGLTTGVNPAGLLQINGTLMNPSMGINKTGVVKQAAGVGLAIVTGGVSLIAQNAATLVSRSNPCDNVLKPWDRVSGGVSVPD